MPFKPGIPRLTPEPITPEGMTAAQFHDGMNSDTAGDFGDGSDDFSGGGGTDAGAHTQINAPLPPLGGAATARTDGDIDEGDMPLSGTYSTQPIFPAQADGRARAQAGVLLLSPNLARGPLIPDRMTNTGTSDDIENDGSGNSPAVMDIDCDHGPVAEDGGSSHRSTDSSGENYNDSHSENRPHSKREDPLDSKKRKMPRETDSDNSEVHENSELENGEDEGSPGLKKRKMPQEAGPDEGYDNDEPDGEIEDEEDEDPPDPKRRKTRHEEHGGSRPSRSKKEAKYRVSAASESKARKQRRSSRRPAGARTYPLKPPKNIRDAGGEGDSIWHPIFIAVSTPTLLVQTMLVSNTAHRTMPHPSTSMWSRRLRRV